uniref:Uncharacterized protein n=1 Tax=Anguilla anguilla TaxID=7936 RepID=A0A0E9QZ90_ANGAN
MWEHHTVITSLRRCSYFVFLLEQILIQKLAQPRHLPA